ncbi:hypothetical protein ABID82_007168 [Methylobacterium sp. PvP062]|nr:hypothetical protein [Methylobacterium sp. PvP105]MCX7336512.1 hypothetical protein [Hyphomicrobiales bacterium]
MTLPTSSMSSAYSRAVLPLLPTRESDRFIAQFTNRLEDTPGSFRRKRLPVASAPNRAQQDWLEQRRDELRRALVPTPGPEANREIMLLIASKANFGADAQELTTKVGFYAQALAGEPTWAIERARLRFRQPGWRCLWDGKGCPSDTDVVAECRYETLPIETELARIEAILGAELYDTGATDDDRANAVAHWETVKAEMRGESVITEQTEDEISAERASMARANDRFRERARAEAEAQCRGQAMWGRLPISDELARQIGLRVPIPADHEEEVH